MLRAKQSNFDLVVAATLTFIAVIFALGQANLGILRVIFTLPLVFALPGYALLTAIVPERPFSLHGVVYVVGLSLSITVLGGFVLNYTAWGLTTAAWAIFLGVITQIMNLVAMLRRKNVLQVPSVVLPRLDARSVFLLALAALIISFAVRFAAVGAEQQNVGEFTQLWMTPTQQQQVDLGIRNDESSPTAYKLRVVADNQVIQEWPSIKLDPGAQWQTSLTLPSMTVLVSSNSTSTVEALLYRLDAPDQVYRHVSLSR